MPAPLPASLRFFSPLFLLCLILTGGAALGLRRGMIAVSHSLQKQPISLRRPLTLLKLGPESSFQPAERPTLPRPEQDAEVGTADLYWREFAQRGAGGGRGKHVGLLITYYSEAESKVPHSPDVCYRQVGVTVSGLYEAPIEVPELGAASPVRARVLHLEKGPWRAVLLFVFCANGEFFNDRQAVRWRIAWPGDRYVYFSKVEAMSSYRSDEDRPAALEACKALLRDALTALAREHYPETSTLRGP